MVLIACANAAAALAANAGGVFPQLDVIAQLAPLLAGIGLGGLLAASLSPQARTPIRVASLIGLLASVALIAPAFARPRGPSAPPDAPGQIKVIQINALRSNTDIGRVADWLIAQRPDIVTISEARHDLRDLLLRRTGWKTAGAAGNLMILTPDAYTHMTRPKAPPGSLLTFVNATYAIQGQPTEIVTTHLLHPTDPGEVGQLPDLVRIVAARPRPRMILTGDFNSSPWSHSLRRLDRELGLTRRDAVVPTWPAQLMGVRWPWPLLPIDHVYAGPAWATVKVERGPWLGSDHYPLVVTLAPAAPR
jgi:endonuclease/exonuclease/phosphatase (EEP) superfamily protein YafD